MFIPNITETQIYACIWLIYRRAAGASYLPEVEILLNINNMEKQTALHTDSSTVPVAQLADAPSVVKGLLWDNIAVIFVIANTEVPCTSKNVTNTIDNAFLSRTQTV